jgi:hypothetical protein
MPYNCTLNPLGAILEVKYGKDREGFTSIIIYNIIDEIFEVATMSIFEIIMLICFGAAWPFSIYRSYTSKSVKGKSFVFLFIVFIGYIAGILHKIFYNFDNVIYLYTLNMLMVGIDMLLFLRNRRLIEIK